VDLDEQRRQLKLFSAGEEDATKVKVGSSVTPLRNHGRLAGQTRIAAVLVVCRVVASGSTLQVAFAALIGARSRDPHTPCQRAFL